MKSYKYLILSLMLLLSTTRPTFCMDGDFYPASKDNSPATNSSIIGSNGSQSPTGSHRSIADETPSLSDGYDDDSSLAYYTPRNSLTYTGLANFDNRSVDDLTKDQAFLALMEEINAETVQTNTPRITSPEIVMVSAALGFLGSAITRATPAIRSIRLDETTKTLPIMVTEAAFQLFKACGSEIGLAITLSVLLAETRKTMRIEQKNNDLRKKIKALEDGIKNGAIVIKKHESVERGLLAAEHKVLNDVHQYLREEAELIAKGSQSTQAVATLQTIIKKNKKITEKVTLTMGDLEKIHTEAEGLLKLDDNKQYSILNPQEWFKALTGFFHKHSAS